MNIRDFTLGVLASIISGVFVYKYFETAKAEEETKIEEETKLPIIEGKIIPNDIEIMGDCINSNSCLVGKEILIISPFKNIGDFTVRNKIGLSINDEIVKEELVELYPYQEYSLIYNMVVEEKLYDICSLVW